ncbi:MAG: hypothetical protein MUF15_26715 [Acidobacteria bacterium]|jgi:hypothetical protein|nr:hypothetical protein [Acidobacteriota bacterium]
MKKILIRAGTGVCPESGEVGVSCYNENKILATDKHGQTRTIFMFLKEQLAWPFCTKISIDLLFIFNYN